MGKTFYCKGRFCLIATCTQVLGDYQKNLRLRIRNLNFREMKVFNRNKMLEYLAKITSLDQLIPNTYIVFLTKLQKGQIPQNGSALFKNDITTSEPAVRMLDI